MEVLPALRESLTACEYYAFDCEMTGLFTNDNQQNYLDELEDRYAQVCLIGSLYLYGIIRSVPVGRMIYSDSQPKHAHLQCDEGLLAHQLHQWF